MSRCSRCVSQSPQGWSARGATPPAPRPPPRRVRAACSPPRRAGRSACATRQKAHCRRCPLRTHLLETLLGALCGGLCLCVVRAHPVRVRVLPATNARANLWRAGPAPGEAAARGRYTYAGARKRARGGFDVRGDPLLEDVDALPRPSFLRERHCRAETRASCGGHSREGRGRGDEDTRWTCAATPAQLRDGGGPLETLAAVATHRRVSALTRGCF